MIGRRAQKLTGVRRSVLSLFVLALSNMERPAERDGDRGFSEAEREARLCLVAGYVVRRVRGRNKREAPDTTAPPLAA